MTNPRRNTARYDAIIVEIFRRHYNPGINFFEFSRSEFIEVATLSGIALPKNLGDVLYSFRFRKDLPKEISDTAPAGLEWLIELAGHGNYKFRLSSNNRIVPRTDMIRIKVPDSTPEIITTYASNDEQALLAKVRYNRLIDIFLGITAYSLQNHLRTTVSNIGQIEIDELYVGLNRHGTHFVVPVQAKGERDKIAIVQAKQDIAYCAKKFPELVCRAVSAQFISNDVIVLFELRLNGDEVRVVDEKHYKLVPGNAISGEDLRSYRMQD